MLCSRNFEYHLDGDQQHILQFVQAQTLYTCRRCGKLKKKTTTTTQKSILNSLQSLIKAHVPQILRSENYR